MANKLKDFLFPPKSNNQFDSTTIVVNKEEIINNKPVERPIEKPQVDVTMPKPNNVRPNIVTPKEFMQVEEVANQLLMGRSVIVDLTSTEINEAKRICDFLNGVTFALDGKVEKIAKLVYLFSPKN